MTNKTTYAVALTYALDNLPDAPEEIREKLVKLLEQTNKRNTQPSKPTARQNENAAISAAIVEFLAANGRKTIGQLVAECPACMGMTSQRVTALVSVMTKGEGAALNREVDKRIAYFSAK